jgi:fibronectin type 3 domain-containing protein/azurin
MIFIAKNFREKHFTLRVGIVTALVALATLCAGVLPATAQTPSQVGQWAGPISWPWVSIHLVHLPSGKILFFDFPDDVFGGETATVWDPTDGSFTAVPNTVTDLFCAGHAYLPDGRPFIVGGNLIPGAGLVDSNIFDEVTNTWTLTAPMAHPRWYPSVTTLPDGRILVMSGSDSCETCIVATPEVYDSTTNTWTQLTTANKSLPLYPHTFVLPDGRVFVSSASRASINSTVLNMTTQTWTNVDNNKFDAHTAVMYAPGKIMKSGSSADVGGPTTNAAATTYVIDMNQPSPSWTSVAPMANRRAFHTMTLLPDGTVLATGGGSHLDGIDTAFAVFAAELWSPSTQTWTTMASMQIPRLYHGNAILLQDGRVLVSGGGRFGTEPQLSAEIYSPPYLFKGARPTITSAPGAGIYGATVFVGTPDAAQISSVSFIALGAATHGFDYNQRFLNLSFSQTTGGLNVQMPANANLATPGYYMLFLLNSAGVPSVAKVMLVGADSDGDGLPDAWERTFLGNLGSGATSDPDADGATNTQELAAGTRPNVADTDGDGYSDGAEISAGSDPRNPNSIPIPILTVSPPSIFASGPQNGANPASQQLSITNPSVGTLNWTASANQPWLGVSPISGTAPSTLTVSFSTAGLGQGTYNGTITVTAPGASGTPKSIPVSLTVTPAGTNGTAASYGFEQGSGNLAVDSSGNANNGTINNASWTTQGKYGNALSFNGASSYVSVPDAPTLDLGSAGSMEAWIKMSTAGRWNAVLAKGNVNDNKAHNYGIEIDDTNRVLCIVGNGSAANVVTSAAVLAANTFYHVACTWNGSTIALYINGALNTSGTQTITPVGNTSPLYIGQFGGNADRFDGIIDEVRIYNRALTLALVQQDMNAPVIGGGGTPDTTPPTAPTNLGATPVSVSQINLSWTASTDNVAVTGYQVERCQSAGCSNFAQVATSTSTTFNDTGLQASTPYSYRVRAVDGATNPSPYSNTASGTTLAPPPPDTTPPTAPSNLGATAVNAGQINLSWTASTDNIGVTGYRIERCAGSGCSNFAQIAAPTGTGTTYNDTTSLQPSTSYSYRVLAVDAVPNLSAYSNIASATTPAAPTGLMAAYGFSEGIGTTTSDASGNGNNGTLTGTTWTTQGQSGNALSFNGTSSFVSIPDAASLDLGSTGTIEAWVKLTSINRWNAVMAKGNTNNDPAHNYAIDISTANRVICYVGNGSSAVLLTSTSALAANTFYHLACTWNGSTIALYINGTLNASVGQSITPAGNTSPLYIGQFGGNADRLAGIIDEVRIYNRALTVAQVQQDMNTPVGGAPTPDTTPPTAPTGLGATAASASQINLSWTASTDNVGVTGYQVERCQNAGCSNFAQVATPTGTTFQDTGLLASTPYSYRVRAVDAAANPSGYSNTASATTSTPPPPDTTPPSAPSNLTATAIGAGQINLGWTASTDNVGVTGYRVERCAGAGCSNFAQIAAPTGTGTTYNDTTSLQPSTSYSYRVLAVDAVPNLSGYSNVASATTGAASTGLVASYPFSEGAGATTADHSGNANHGTITGATWTVQGKFGNALSFNGTSNFVSIPDAATLDLSIAGTVEAWVRMSSASRWNSVLAKGNSNSNPAHNYAMEITDTNRVLCILGNGSASLVVTSASALTNNTFFHLACTWDGATVSLYINGALSASSDQTISPNGNTSPLYIGQFGGNSDRFAGVIDEVRIYNRALSPTEIQQDSTTPIP